MEREKAMNDGYVRQLADGEELVVETNARRRVNDDPRDRTIEARRQAFDEPANIEVNAW